MSAYYAFLLDRGNRVIGRADLTSATVDEAVEAASDLLRADALRCESVEVWHGTRIMRRIERSAMSSETGPAEQMG
jgi:hypothetical protein